MQESEGRCETYRRLETVESATDAAPLMGDFTSMAPPLISSASCDCVGEVSPRATPPSISVSDILVFVVQVSQKLRRGAKPERGCE